MSMDVPFRDGSVLVLPKQLLNKLRAVLAISGYDFESGGILLGSKEARSSRFVVKEITFPSSLDTRKRFAFIRSKNGANQAIERAWRASGGTVNYLGEWHTHNEKSPCPSSADQNLIGDLVIDGSTPFGRIFMLIAGNSDEIFVGMTTAANPNGFVEERRAKWPV